MVKGTSSDGYPFPLRGKPITKTPIVVKKTGVSLKKYPEKFIPGKEKLGKNEMRLTCIGSGNPFVRRAQAATGWFVETGNGDKFVFDVGGGTVQNLWSLEVPPAQVDKLFLTHLHLDHTGDFHVLYDALGWARNTPLHVWGPSGNTEEEGTAYYCDMMRKAATWHTESKKGVAPSGGHEIIAHEFDVNKFSPDNPRQLVYDTRGVKIYAFPVMHILIGAVAYRLEWNGLSMTFHGDGSPTSFEAEQAEGVDVFMHESFLDAESLAKSVSVPLNVARNIASVHTTPDKLGKLFDIAKPKLGVGYHYTLSDEVVDLFFKNLGKTYDGPVVLAQDLMVINITPEQIVTRIAGTDLLHKIPPQPKVDKPPKLEEPSKAVTPKWISSTLIKSNTEE